MSKTPQPQTTVKERPRKTAAENKSRPSSAATATPSRKPAAKPQPPAVKAHEAPSRAPRAPAAEERAVLIARIAYFRAEARGFAPGNELADWYAAEAELDEQLAEDR